MAFSFQFPSLLKSPLVIVAYEYNIQYNPLNMTERQKRMLFMLVFLIIVTSLYALLRLLSTDIRRMKSAIFTEYQKHQLIDVKDDTPTHYYLDMRLIAKWVREKKYGHPPFDDNGIPLVDYGKYKVEEIPEKKYYNPVTVAQYGLGVYEEYLHGNKKGKQSFLKQADWLLGKINENGEVPIEIPLPSRGLEPPWVSAMAQGETISVLTRAYVLTNDPAYLDGARKAFLPFTKNTTEGGVVYEEGGELWLEEYPENPPSHVLNGYIFALFGLYDLYRVTKDPEVKVVFDQAVDTLSKNIHRYEKDGWVLYQLKGDKFANNYYGLHVEQLKALAAISGRKEFEETAKRWEWPLKHPFLYLLKRLPERILGKISPAS